MNTKILSVSISLALLFVASSASAELIIDDGARKPTIQAAPQAAPAKYSSASGTSASGTGWEWRRYGAPNGLSDQSVAAGQAFVTQSGSRPATVNTAGWAKDMPLSLAIRQVVPSDFEVKENGVSLTKHASWSGDRPWDQTLETLSQQGDFVSHIDWSKKQVSLAPRLPATAVAHVAPAPVKIAPAVAAPVKPKPSALTISETVSPQFVAATRPIAPPAAQWVLSPSMTLRENVESWAKKAGWSVVWEAADYPIIASANFSGDFASAEGPLAKLIGAYESSDQPLIANLTTMDRVVYVKNKFHERTQVVPTSPIEMTPTH